MGIYKCIMFAACNSTRHIKCDRAQPHEDCGHNEPCPKGIIFGYNSYVKCFEVKNEPIPDSKVPPIPK